MRITTVLRTGTSAWLKTKCTPRLKASLGGCGASSPQTSSTQGPAAFTTARARMAVSLSSPGSVDAALTRKTFSRRMSVALKYVATVAPLSMADRTVATVNRESSVKNSGYTTAPFNRERAMRGSRSASCSADQTS